MGTGAGDGRVDQGERPGYAAVREEALSAAEDNREDHQPVLIDQARVVQGVREVSRMTGTEVNVSGGEFRLSTDGELSGPHRSVTWKLLPGVLRMHLPRPD